MIRLGDVKAYVSRPLEGVFADATVVEDAALAAIKGPALVIAEGVVPDEAAKAFVLESDLAACGRAVLFPTVSVVTGGFVDRGLRYLPEGQGGDSAGEDLVLPQPAGRFRNNETPQLAFETAHDIWAVRTTQGMDGLGRMAVDLSLGADAENGEWWLAGALSAVLGLPMQAELDALFADPTELLPSLHSYAARVRQQSALPVCVLDRRQSATARSMLTDLAPVDYWTRFIAACTDMGLEHTAHRYRRAAERIWS